MDIAHVARTAGLPASTLRFYEEKGLVAPVGRQGCGGCSMRACSTGWRSSRWAGRPAFRCRRSAP
nr:MerR family DNA-binding transcriptional regulator [Ramlibacter sp.]